MHPMSLFDYKYRGDADESTGVDTGANAGAVSDDPTEPAALIETALTDPTDGSSTDASGYPGDKEQPEIVIHLLSTLEELFAPTDWGDVLRLVNFKWDESRVTPHTRAIGGTFEFTFILPKQANTGNTRPKKPKHTKPGRKGSLH